jgi:magnesium transporter
MPLFTKKYSKPGSAPGEALLAPGESEAGATLSVMDFSAQNLSEATNVDPSEVRRYLDSPEIAWLHIQGNPSARMLKNLGEVYGLHTLALEDVFKAGQRSKAEDYKDHFFVLINIPVESSDGPGSQPASFLLGERYLLSVHNGDESNWDPDRKRLRNDPPTRVRLSGADYLLYTLLDTAIDHALPYLETLATQIESLEDSIFRNPDPAAIDALHAIRHKLIFLRRMLWPQRDMINTLLRDEEGLIQEHTKVFLRDCYDHTVQILELAESYHEVSTSMHDLYLSSLSNRMNEVMKVLTMIATIFIPLSFVVGIYGMNFDTRSPWNMPELNAHYGYPVLLALMLAAGVAMVVYFKRKGWF